MAGLQEIEIMAAHQTEGGGITPLVLGKYYHIRITMTRNIILGVLIIGALRFEWTLSTLAHFAAGFGIMAVIASYKKDKGGF